MKLPSNRPYPHVINPETEMRGVGIQRRPQPQHPAHWVVGDDGTLTCRWNID